MITVTPSLFVGVPEDLMWIPDSSWAFSAAQAVAVISVGRSALIPYDGWKTTVRKVLCAFDCEDDWIDSRIRMAETGQP